MFRYEYKHEAAPRWPINVALRQLKPPSDPTSVGNNSRFRQLEQTDFEYGKADSTNGFREFFLSKIVLCSRNNCKTRPHYPSNGKGGNQN